MRVTDTLKPTKVKQNTCFYTKSKERKSNYLHDTFVFKTNHLLFVCTAQD